MGDKSLIGGIDKKDMEDYLSDWPCKCGHVEKDHMILPFDDTLEKSGAGVVTINLPYRVFCVAGFKGPSYFKCECYNFKPVDNLTLIEMTAKEKGLIR